MLRVAQGTIAGIAAGILAGIGARIAMRLVAIGVADGVGVRPEFTIGGTFAIAVVGAIVGAPAGALYALVEQRLPGPARARGLWFAGLLLAFLGPVFFMTEEFFSSGRVLLFLVLFPIFGLALGVALPLAARLAPRLPGEVQRLLAIAAACAGAFVLFGFAGAAGEALERRGAVTAVFAIPWIALVAFLAPALRTRLARLQAARQ